ACECEVCGKLFVVPNEMRRHKETHMDENDPNKKRHKCNECGKGFRNSVNLRHHMSTHKDENDPAQAQEKRPFKCEVCSDTFRTAKNLAD
ncbi:hypothetical protein PMAYCL1PPCAC_01861, partial [Pristionchus mayeri]